MLIKIKIKIILFLGIIMPILYTKGKEINTKIIRFNELTWWTSCNNECHEQLNQFEPLSVNRKYMFSL